MKQKTRAQREAPKADWRLLLFHLHHSIFSAVVMKCPQLLNSLVLLQFVIVSLANDEEIDKRREFNGTSVGSEIFFFSELCRSVPLEIAQRWERKHEDLRWKQKIISQTFPTLFPSRYAFCLLKIPLCKAIRSRWWWSYFKCAMHKWKRSMSWHAMERWKLKSALKRLTKWRANFCFHQAQKNNGKRSNLPWRTKRISHFYVRL